VSVFDIGGSFSMVAAVALRFWVGLPGEVLPESP
jgi:hypothetical protein